MRFLLWFLLFVSLPLRAWVGDSMALEMLRSQPHAMQNIAATADESSAGSHFHADMPEMKTGHGGHAGCAGPSPQSAPATDPTPHCADGSCSWCQVCHTVAAVTGLPAVIPAWVPHTRPQAGSTSYASVLPALALKPPIS